MGVLLLHISAGTVALVAGYIALFSGKGERLHRKSGLAFVGAMVVMGVSAPGVAAVRDVDVIANLVGGGFAAYLAVTAFTTVRPLSRRVDLILLGVGVAFAAMMIIGALQKLALPVGERGDVPIPMRFLMAGVALLATVGDVRILRSGALQGSRRIARHMWRMCYALFIAAGSFFAQVADRLPAALRSPLVILLPVLIVLLAMGYWFWRLRRRARPIAFAMLPSAPERSPS
jgi:hypothetical protein